MAVFKSVVLATLTVGQSLLGRLLSIHNTTVTDVDHMRVQTIESVVMGGVWDTAAV
jgi:hypothetical protein